MTSDQAEWKRTSCMLCSIACGLEIQEQDGKFLKIRGDKSHGTSHGYLCQKASRLDHYQNHNMRLSQPLKKMEDGKFRAISWDTAIKEIAQKLNSIKHRHGGHTIAYYGGGGQGNHLGGSYSSAFRDAVGSVYAYSALAQEKTGDFWVNGKLFGRQSCFVSEGMHDAEYTLVLGANPWIAHGLPQTRMVLQAIQKDPNRTLVVVDPRKSETAKIADIHLAVKPGRDAFLLSAIIATIIKDGLVDQAFISKYTIDYERVRKTFESINIPEFAEFSGIELAQVETVAHGFAKAKTATVRADLGIQQSLHSTLNSYLEKLLFLLTGNFNKAGGNFLAPLFAPIIAHSEDPENGGLTTKVTGMRAISKLFPPNILPQEILTDHPDKLRAMIVDSANPALSVADGQACKTAFEALDLLVVIDIAHTETAELADYILPAPSQFEKVEASFFTFASELNHLPTTYFHLRKPITKQKGNTLPEPEIYRRLTVAVGAIPDNFPVLEQAAKLDRKYPKLRIFPLALAAYLKLNPKMTPYVSLILYSTFGKALPNNNQSAAAIWGVCQFYAQKWEQQIRRTGLKEKGYDLGNAMFERFLTNDSAQPIASFLPEDSWKLLRQKDKKVHLAIDVLLEQITNLQQEILSNESAETRDYPFILMAGERRSYNANQIYRTPDWRKKDTDGALRLHPDDAKKLNVAEGEAIRCRSNRAAVDALVSIDDTVQPGMVTLPHGYGMRYFKADNPSKMLQNGPAINELTDSSHCDSIAKTPFHKYVPVALEKVTVSSTLAEKENAETELTE